MASSAVCVLVYRGASASIQTLWQAAVVLLHPSGVELSVCVCVCVCVFVCECVQYVRRHFWECDCIPACNVCFHRHVRTVWVCAVAIPRHSESHSLKPHQRACGRQNDKARNQPASACSHTQTQTHAHTTTQTHAHTPTHTHTHTHIHTHTFITLTHLLIDTRCLMRSPSLSLSLSLSLSCSLSPHTHTC